MLIRPAGLTMHFTFSRMKRTLCGLVLDGNIYFTNDPGVVSCRVCDDRYHTPIHFVKKAGKKKALCKTKSGKKFTNKTNEISCVECLNYQEFKNA